MSYTSYCVFCEIVAGRSPAAIRYVDEEIIVIVNRLTWVPVMPKKHLSQIEAWRSGLMARLGNVAVEMGCTYASEGLRVLSNVGSDALQTQGHGHLHVIGGTSLGPYA